MLKFLLYLFLFYVVSRLLFGKLTGTGIGTKIYRFNTHHHHYHESNPNAAQAKEGSTKKGNDNHLGDYVDYEEIK